MPQVSFTVNDSGVSSFVQRIQRDAQQLSQSMQQDASRQTNSAREQLSIVERQLQLRLQQLNNEKKLTEEGIKQRTEQLSNSRITKFAELNSSLRDKFNSGEIDVNEYRARRSRLRSIESQYGEGAVQAEGQEQLRLLEEQLRTQQQLLTSALIDTRERRTNTREEQAREKSRGQEFMKYAAGQTWERVTGMVANIPNTQNELDYIKPMASMMGMLSGMLTGTLAEVLTAGQIEFATIGTQLGGKVGEFMGSAVERTFRSRDELTSSNLKLKSLTGKGNVEQFGKETSYIDENGVRQTGGRLGGTGMIDNLQQDYTRYGLSYAQTSQLQYGLSMRQGSSRDLDKLTETVLALEHGLGVSQQTSTALIELTRQNKGTDKDISKIVGGILQKGSGTIFTDGDRSYLNEFITKNYTQLHKTLLQTNTRVSSGTTMDILTKFDKMGGVFDAKDSRSTGYINQIQGALSNPGSDSMKAMAYHVMRQQNPEMGLADIGIEIQKGLGSEKYLQSMMKHLTSSGGDKDYQVYNIASAFGLQNNLDVAKQLLEGYEKGNLSTEFVKSELSGTGKYSRGSIVSTAEGNVNNYAQSTAEITNEFIKGAIPGITLVGTKMTALFGDMMKGVKDYVDMEIDKLKGSSKNGTNKTYTPKKYNNSSMNEVDGMGNPM